MRRIILSLSFLLLITILFVFIHNNKESIFFPDSSHLDQVPNEMPEYYSSNKILIIGDSRMVGASKVVSLDNVFFVAKNGTTCNYLWEEAVPEAEAILKQYPDDHFTIFLNLGINDLDRWEWENRQKEVDSKTICDADTYADYYIKLKEKWPTHNFFFVSVNPLDEDVLKSGKYKDLKMSTNQKVEEFNAKVASKVTEKDTFYCDTFHQLIDEGYETTDGLHYSEETYKDIIEKIEKCKRDIEAEREF